MEEIWNLVGIEEDPLHVCDGVKNKWSRSKAKGENQVQKNAVGGVYGHIVVGGLHIKFSHVGPRTKFGDQADHLIDCDVMKGEFVQVNPIVDTSPPPSPPGEERSTMRRHFPGWPLLGITPKLLT